MFTLEAINKLNEVLSTLENAHDFAIASQNVAVHELLLIELNDVKMLSEKSNNLFDLLCVTDDHIDDVVLYDVETRFDRAVSEAECRICEIFHIDMSLDFTNKSINDLEETDEDTKD